MIVTRASFLSYLLCVDCGCVCCVSVQAKAGASDIFVLLGFQIPLTSDQVVPTLGEILSTLF